MHSFLKDGVENQTCGMFNMYQYSFLVYTIGFFPADNHIVKAIEEQDEFYRGSYSEDMEELQCCLDDNKTKDDALWKSGSSSQNEMWQTQLH